MFIKVPRLSHKQYSKISPIKHLDREKTYFLHYKLKKKEGSSNPVTQLEKFIREKEFLSILYELRDRYTMKEKELYHEMIMKLIISNT